MWNERDPPLNKDNGPIDQLGSRFVKSSHWSRKPSSLIHCRAGELPALPGLVVATSATGIYWFPGRSAGIQNTSVIRMQGYKKRTLKFENKKNHSSFLNNSWTAYLLSATKASHQERLKEKMCFLMSVQIVTFPRSRYSEIHWADRALPAVPQSSLRKPRFISQ